MDIDANLKSDSTTSDKSSWWYWFTKLDQNLAGCKNCDWVKSRGTAKSTSILRSHLKTQHPELLRQKIEAGQFTIKVNTNNGKRGAAECLDEFVIGDANTGALDAFAAINSNALAVLGSPAHSQVSSSDVFISHHEKSPTPPANKKMRCASNHYSRPIHREKEKIKVADDSKFNSIFASLVGSLAPKNFCGAGSSRNTNFVKSEQTVSTHKQPKAPPIVKISRVEQFSAAHRLHNPKFSADTNRKIFDKCNNPNGHGHNYKWKVVLEGPVNADTGMVYNLTDLKREMSDVMQLVDHKNLDLDVAHFRDGGFVSTTENLTIFLFYQLASRMSNPKLLKRVVVEETEKNSFSYSPH